MTNTGRLVVACWPAPMATKLPLNQRWGEVALYFAREGEMDFSHPQLRIVDPLSFMIRAFVAPRDTSAVQQLYGTDVVMRAAFDCTMIEGLPGGSLFYLANRAYRLGRTEVTFAGSRAWFGDQSQVEEFLRNAGALIGVEDVDIPRISYRAEQLAAESRLRFGITTKLGEF